MRTQKIAEQDDIAGYWGDARCLPPLPEFLYYALRGHGIRSMALWRLRCHGEGVMPGYRGGSVWSASKDDLIWFGPEWKPHSTDLINGKRYPYLKETTDLTLEGALVRLRKFADEHRQHLVYSLQRQVEREEELRRDRVYLEERFAEASTFNLRVEKDGSVRGDKT
jgi:hypothetical protein